MYVFVYDISNNRRRTRLHKKLLNYGTAVQLSVFEISERCYGDVVALCQKELKREDKVRIYRLCKRCETATQILGPSKPLLSDSEQPVVIEVPDNDAKLQDEQAYSLARGPLETGHADAQSHLMEMICGMDNLNQAFLDVRANRGCAGSDGISLAAFDRRRGFHLSKLQQELLDGTYRPKPLRVFTIPKSDGTQRTLKVPGVRDRVAQQATLRVIGPVWERELEDSSYAYRKGRSVRQAVAKVRRYRDEGRRIVVRADIDAYFDEIPHEPALAKFREKIKDEQVVCLVALWMGTPAEHATSATIPPRGIPQGSVISPLLSNIYLDRFDEAIDRLGYKMVRYADDFLIACKDAVEAKGALAEVERELAIDSLKLNTKKTVVTDYRKGFTFLGYLFIGNIVMKKTKIPSGWRIGTNKA
jgi:group II intron reverse transcriptase/maturase/CRISPR-associated endonuclease Cas2